MSRYRVGLTRDFLNADGRIGWGDIGTGVLDADPAIDWDFIQTVDGEIPPHHVDGYDALLVLGPRVTRDTLSGGRLRHVARFGVGYDNVDVVACTEAGVPVTITPDGVRRPVAIAALALTLAATHRLREKDDLVRSGRWHDKLDYMGAAVTGRTLGIVGLGNIGREFSRMAAPLGMVQIAADPYADPGSAESLGVRLVDLDVLMADADVVVVTTVLTEQTRHLLDARRLGLMKPTAFVVNVSRGPVVDQAALTQALAAGRIAGAALDVFDPEPPAADDPLLSLPNVLLAPHATAWTAELALGNGSSAIAAIRDLAAGRRPAVVVNPDAFRHPRWTGPTAATASAGSSPS